MRKQCHPQPRKKEHQRESTVGAASVGEHTPKSTGGSATEEHANTESKDATVQEADVKAVDEDTASEACDASGVEPASCEPPRVKGKRMKTEVDKTKLAVNDIVRLSMQRNKQFYDGYEAQVIALLAREAKVVLLEGPKKGEDKSSTARSRMSTRKRPRSHRR